MSEYLPVEVILEILRKLPVKSLVKCRSVCKTWNSLITNPSFISNHLQTSISTPNTPLLLLRLFKDDKEQYFLHFDNNDFDEFKQLHFPFQGSRLGCFDIFDSCNGLVCILVHPILCKLILWNPSIQKYITLPNPSPHPSMKEIRSNFCLRLWIRQSNFTFGFGYDSKTNDFKVVRMLAYDEYGEFTNLTDVDLFDLFSLNGNSWKKVTASSSTYKTKRLASSAFVNGSVHWLGFKSEKHGGFKNVVLGFDISSEDFFVIQLPESLTSSSHIQKHCSVMKYEESSIAVFKRWDSGEIDIWVMKEYGIDGSWSKVLHLTEPCMKLVTRVLWFRKNGEVLLEVDSEGMGEMASLDLNGQRIEYLGINGQRWSSVVHSYVENLVLLDKGIDANNVIERF